MFYVGQLSLELRGKLKAFKDELISGSEHFGLVAQADCDCVKKSVFDDPQSPYDQCSITLE